MNRKIMVEVTEEELKELDKEKTLDDYVDGLLYCLAKNKPTKEINRFDEFTYQAQAVKQYETQRFCINVLVDNLESLQIKIEKKRGKQ